MSNNLTGPLPDEWSGMRALRYLWVAACPPACGLQGLAVGCMCLCKDPPSCTTQCLQYSV